MQPSIVGLLVAGAIYTIGRQRGLGLVFALLASLAFQGTAFAALPALGGSSPLIYTLFAIAMIIGLILRRDVKLTVRTLLMIHPIGWVLVLLTIYVLAGAYIMPRLFMGDTTVFVPARGASGTGGIVLMRLMPSNVNLTQGAYFVLSILMYFTVLETALQTHGLKKLGPALIGWVIIIISTGYVDLIGKLAGFGDILAPIRTANYSMLTGDEHAIAGIPRINGAFPEASAFAGSLVPALMFSVAYWRVQRGIGLLILAGLLFVLLILSTSTTAYVTTFICAVWFWVAATLAFLMGRVRKVDGLLIAITVIAIVTLFGAYLYNDRMFEPFFSMIDATVFNKLSSSSAIERGMWNAQAFQAFLDSYCFGVGVGSTRTSSWGLAVLSNLGVVGTLGICATLLVIIRGLGGIDISGADTSILAIVRGCRAAAIAVIVGGLLAAPSPDPGVFYFFALATIVAARHTDLLPENRPSLN